MGAATGANVRNIRLSAKQAVAIRLLENNPLVTQVLYGGAAGGGKTWLGCMWQIRRRLDYPGTRGAIGRDELKKLHRTTLKTFMDCWVEFWADSDHNVSMTYNQQAGAIRFSNGSEIVLLDLHQYPSDPDFTSALGSLELTDAFVDEVTEVTERAVQILYSRIRYSLDHLPVKEPKLLMAGNPAHNWVKFRFIKDEQGNAVQLPSHRAFVPALLSDNPDPEFQRIYSKTLSQLSQYDRDRLLYGDWDAVARDGGEAFYSFDPENHVQDVPHIETIGAVHLTFDQNVVPYMTLLAVQVVLDGANAQLRVFREYCLKHPRNSTKAVCEAFIAEYGTKTGGVFIYGDASGSKRDTRAAQSDYDIAASVLRAKMSSTSNRVQRSNPEVRKRVLFLCAIFEGRVPGITIAIDKRCMNLIADLLYIKQDANGGKVKKRITENGVSFEQYGHTSDALEYLVTTVFASQFRAFEKIMQ
jgi:hypothetical protein